LQSPFMPVCCSFAYEWRFHPCKHSGTAGCLQATCTAACFL
jgi:hypothetical protein